MQAHDNATVSPRSLAAMVAVGVMGNSVLYIMPLLVGGMVTARGFTDQEAGYIASADLAGFALATFCATFWVNRWRWLKALLAALALMAIANVASTVVYDKILFAAVRCASGFGAGTLAAIATVALGRTENPDRNFGILFAAALGFATVALWGLPPLLERFGFNAAYWLLVALAVLTVVAAVAVPQAEAHDAGAAGGSWGAAALLICAVLLSVLVFFAEQNSVWAYAERIGTGAGLSPGFIGMSLGLTTLVGVGGAGLVAWLGTRFGRFLPLLGATLLQLAGLVFLRGQPDAMTYAAACAALAFAWNVMNPFQLGILAEIDASGRALPLAATLTGVGLAVGPTLAALVLTGSDYEPVLRLACVLAVVTMLLMLPALRHVRVQATTGGR